LQNITDGKGAVAGPEHVVIDLTNRCNNSCIACWTRSPMLEDRRPKPPWHRQELESTRVEQLVDELHEMGTSVIRFTGGGEPLAYPGIFDVISRVKDHGIYCAVTTALPIDRPDVAGEILSSGMDELAVSLWASNRDEYIRTHPGQPSRAFDRRTEILHAILQARRPKKSILRFLRPAITRPRVHILNVICNRNCGSIEAMYDYAINLGADSLHFTVVDTVDGATDALLPSDQEYAAALRACRLVRTKNEGRPTKDRIQLDGFDDFERRLQAASTAGGLHDRDAVNAIPCYIGWLFARIMADGQVAPCCRGVCIPMGNINTRSFREIWHSKKYNDFRRRSLAGNKSDPPFSQIGCEKVCDNHVQNKEIHQLLQAEKPS